MASEFDKGKTEMLERIKGIDEEKRSPEYWAGVTLVLEVCLGVTRQDAARKSEN
jgi:hypothetical protein